MITFNEFMRLALYDQQSGYYTTARDQIGVHGDFFTSSQVHDVFGGLIAEGFANVWNLLGQPPVFTIVELGPGMGDFADSAISALRHRHTDCFSCLQYVCCEISPSLVEKQRILLAKFSDRIRWIASLEELTEPVRGIFFSNEFFDSLPVHVVRERSGGLVEVYVTREANGRLAFLEGNLSTARLSEYWGRFGRPLGESQLAEINLAAIDWMGWIASRLDSGRVVTIDYGDLADRLYTPDRSSGTLRCFTQHHITDEPLKQVGRQDLTASVNFSAIIEYGRDLGLQTVSYETQSDYLIRMGLLERAAELGVNAGRETPRDLQRRLALKQLFAPLGTAGHYKVLVQEKNVVESLNGS